MSEVPRHARGTSAVAMVSRRVLAAIHRHWMHDVDSAWVLKP